MHCQFTERVHILSINRDQFLEQMTEVTLTYQSNITVTLTLTNVWGILNVKVYCNHNIYSFSNPNPNFKNECNPNIKTLTMALKL